MSTWDLLGPKKARMNTHVCWQSARSAGKSRPQKPRPRWIRLIRRRHCPNVLLRYRDFAKEYYSKDGEPTKEFTEMAIALKPLREHYGATLAREFGPLKLQVVRQHMIDKDLSRGVVNHRVNRINRFIKWATSQQLVPPSVFNGISTVAGLRRGRTTARETDPVTPVDDQHVEATIPYASPQVAAMIHRTFLRFLNTLGVTSRAVSTTRENPDTGIQRRVIGHLCDGPDRGRTGMSGNY